MSNFFYFCAMKQSRSLKITFLLLVCCFACSHSKTPTISHKLPLDSVAVIVADCFFLEGEIYAKQQTFDIKDYAIVKYDSFFCKHGITKEIFTENVKYYFTHKKYAEKIMNLVDTIVEQRVATLRDSLNIKP